MEKKTECEVVQDLLFSYTDGVLKKASKKLVQEHLAECKICQQKLEEIQDETKQNQQERNKKEIDYLKKMRRRAKIKNWVIAFVVFLLPFLFIYLYRLFVISFLIAKYDSFLQEENFYIEKISVESMSDTIFTTRIWYKEGNYKKVTYQRQEGGEETYNEIEYGTVEKNQIIHVNEKDKIARKQNYPWKIEKKNLIPSSNPIEPGHEVWFARFGAPFYWKVSTDTYQIGRPYYVLKAEETQLWMDKQTGMLIQTKGGTSSIQYYEGTNIVKNKVDTTTQYEYQTNVVSEEDVKVPNLDGYDLQEDNTLMEMRKQAEEKLQKK